MTLELFCLVCITISAIWINIRLAYLIELLKDMRGDNE